jgi:hypothetical protein
MTFHSGFLVDHGHSFELRLIIDNFIKVSKSMINAKLGYVELLYAIYTRFDVIHTNRGGN